MEQKPKGTSLFVDGANFFYMQKDRLHWWIDPRRLVDWVKKHSPEGIVDAFYYVAVDNKADVQQDSFLKALTYMGYSLVTKELKTITQQDGGERKKANLDIEIVVDMFNTIDHYDTAILVSGDADFERALQTLRTRGKKFQVLSTQGFVAREIRAVAGMHYIDFQDIREEVEKGGPFEKGPDLKQQRA